MRPRDTSPEAWRVFLDLQSKMPPSEKIERAFAYSAFLRQLAEGVLRQEYPNASEREIFLRAARQRLGPELFRKVYGDELVDDRSTGTSH